MRIPIILPAPCFLSAFLALCLGISCASQGGQDKLNGTGGTCTFQPFPGTATCTEIHQVVSGQEAHFSFSPTDPNARSQYQINGNESNLVLYWTAGGLPPASWLTTNGIVVGKELACTRREIRIGTCTPVMYVIPSMPDVNLQ